MNQLRHGCLAVLVSVGIVCCVSAQDAALRRTLVRIAGKIEPGLVGRADRLPQYVECFRQELGNDTRLFAFDVQAVSRGDSERRVDLQGHVEFSETREALAAFLEILGFSVDNQLQMLPSPSLGDQTLGLLKVSHSLSYDRPQAPRSVVTDCLLGEPLYLLREQQGHLLVHSGEGYIGYVADADILRLSEADFLRYVDSHSIVVNADVRADGRLIPAGARLRCVDTEDAVVRVELPTGEILTLPRSSCEVREGANPKIDRVIHHAQGLIGTPYVWGGKTSSGIDCSGLVQVAFATEQLHLPRDSNQQFLLGQLTATRRHPAGMRRGDTLYFLGSDGKIRHTAIYLGNERYLQAVTPQVRVSSLNPQHEDYDAKRHASFAFAKRLLD